jgi:hypothetical protein
LEPTTDNERGAEHESDRFRGQQLRVSKKKRA